MSELSTATEVLQFAPLPTHISPSFWHQVTHLKLDHLRLDDRALSINASYSIGRTVKDRSRQGETVRIDGALKFDRSSLQNVTPGGAANSSTDSEYETRLQSSGTIVAYGKLVNFNTAVQFGEADKNKIFDELASELLEELLTSQSPCDAITKFSLLTFSDLKKYKFYHWAALPAFIASPSWQTTGLTPLSERWEAGSISDLRDGLKIRLEGSKGNASAGFCLVKRSTNGVAIGEVTDFASFFEGCSEEERTALFLDPSTSPSVAGWPLRNFLTLLACRYGVRKINIVCWRDEPEVEVPSRSLIAGMFLDTAEKGSSHIVHQGASLPIAISSNDDSKPLAVGWERNGQGKLAPKVADLGPLMDPKRLADQAVDLNLKLMRWRILPEVQLEKVAQTRCLLLGAGTLGCYVSRALLGWGVRKITFVDSSKVSYSNPVRQPLFTFEDCKSGGRPKAECAAERLGEIFPGVTAAGVQLSIPMPGHGLLSAGSAAEASARRDVGKLEQLYDEHDAVFLLMDSRESRWLPTMLGSAKNKVVMNAALGFDSYLAMRHGAGPSVASTGSKSEDLSSAPDREIGRLGCYFCNDVVAPADSLTDRTLDQMCTVSRPGLAPIAGASLVELLVSLVQHKDGIAARAPSPFEKNVSDPTVSGSCLGALPHQIRGHLSGFSATLITGSAYDRCTACSATVVKAYKAEGWNMLRRALGEQGYLEKITGLDKMYEETERLLAGEDGGVDEWSEEEEV